MLRLTGNIFHRNFLLQFGSPRAGMVGESMIRSSVHDFTTLSNANKTTSMIHNGSVATPARKMSNSFESPRMERDVYANFSLSEMREIIEKKLKELEEEKNKLDDKKYNPSRKRRRTLNLRLQVLWACILVNFFLIITGANEKDKKVTSDERHRE